MENLILKSLEILNFRGFKHLQIEQLGRVNLIVGKNNVGKSSLLEALQLYAQNGDPALIWKILQSRDESKPYSRSSRIENRPSLENLLLKLRLLFNGRKEIERSRDPIKIGPVNSPDNTLSISIGWYTRESDEEGGSKLRLLQPDEYDLFENPPTPRFTIQTGKTSKIYPLRQDSLLTEVEIKASCIAIAPNGLDRELIGAFWDGIALTDLEQDVVEVMRVIAPGVERLSVVGNIDSKDRPIRSSNNRERGAIPIVKVAGINEPIALRSLGDGMHRVFGLALALVNVKDGMLLIDEIENGLHYSVQVNIWQLVFKLAHRLNVQVFATTHSLDCIRAFQVAAQQNIKEEGLLIRLQSKRGEVSAELYEEEELAIANRNQIEVR